MPPADAGKRNGKGATRQERCLSFDWAGTALRPVYAQAGFSKKIGQSPAETIEMELLYEYHQIRHS